MNVEASYFIVESEHTITSTEYFPVSVAIHVHRGREPCQPHQPQMGCSPGFHTFLTVPPASTPTALWPIHHPRKWTWLVMPGSDPRPAAPGGTCPSASSYFQCPQDSKATWPQMQQLTKLQMVIVPE